MPRRSTRRDARRAVLGSPARLEARRRQLALDAAGAREAGSWAALAAMHRVGLLIEVALAEARARATPAARAVTLADHEAAVRASLRETSTELVQDATREYLRRQGLELRPGPAPDAPPVLVRVGRLQLVSG